MDELKEYQVEISIPAQKRYQHEVLSYLLDNFSLERSVEIDSNIVETLKTLMFLPSRGKKELFLEKQ